MLLAKLGIFPLFFCSFLAFNSHIKSTHQYMNQNITYISTIYLPCDHLWAHVEMSRFWASDAVTCSKLSQMFIAASTCDNKTPRQVSWFFYFVWILYN
jgi:hypothetical protein